MIYYKNFKILVSKRNEKFFEKESYTKKELKKLIIKTREYSLCYFLEEEGDEDFFKEVFDREIKVLQNNHKDIKNYHNFYTIFTFIEKSKIKKTIFKKEINYLFQFLKKDIHEKHNKKFYQKNF